jgi:hypothetical protein
MRRVLSGGFGVVALALIAVTQAISPGTAQAAGAPDASQLPALNNDIFAQLNRPNGLGVQVSYTGVDPTANQVVVGLLNYSPAIAQSLQRQYGAGRVRVVPAQPFHLDVLKRRKAALGPLRPAPSGGVSPQDNVGTCDGLFCAPTRGGVYLEQDSADGQFVFSCTSTIVGTSGGGQRSTLTAGHCFDSGRPVRYGTFDFLHGFPTGANLGDVVARLFGASSDHEVIGWVTGGGAAGRDFLTNCIFVPGVDCQRINFNAALSDMPVGAEVTQRGFTTGRTLGHVVLNSANVNVGGTALTDQVVTSACSIPGDSGGAAFIADRLLGTISGGNWVQPQGQAPQCNPNGPMSVVAKATNAFWNLGFSSRLAP